MKPETKIEAIGIFCIAAFIGSIWLCAAVPSKFGNAAAGQATIFATLSVFCIMARIFTAVEK